MKLKNVSRCLFTGLAVAATPFLLLKPALAADERATDDGKSDSPIILKAALAGDIGHLPESEIIGATWKTDPDPALRAFAKWVDKFLQASPEDQLTLEDEGVKLAKTRQKALKEQITDDPRRALANAVPIAVRDQLPHAVVKYLEKRVDSFADWGTQCSFPQPDAKGADGQAAQASEIETAEVAGQTFKAHHYGTPGARFVEGGSLHGIAIDGELAVLNSPLRALEPGEQVKGSVTDFSKIKFDGKSGGAGLSNGTGPQNFRYYQIGGGKFAKAATASQANWAESAIKRKQNSYTNLRESITSSDDWVPSTEPQALADSGAAGSSSYLGRPPASHTNGVKKVLIMRVQSPAHMLDSWNLNNSNLTNQSADINTRYAYISNNRVSIQFDYTPVYTLPSSFDNFNADAWRDEARARSQSSGYNLNNYDVHVTLHGPADTGYGGLQSGNHLWLNNTYNQFVFIHEFGHWLSLPHSGLFKVTDGNPMSPSRTIEGYGDGTCYMGGSYNTYNLGLYNPAYQNKLRWMSDNDVQTITQSGTYTVYQYDGPTENRVRALKLPRDKDFNFWLSIRGNVDGAYPAHGNGVAIRAQTAYSGNDAWVVDMKPNDGGSENAPLLLNEEWYDSAADLRIKTVGVGGTSPNRYVTVQVTFGATHSAGYRPLVNNGIYRFSHRSNANLSLTGVAGSANGGSLVATTSSDTNALQQWVAKRNSDGTYSFNLLGTDKNIDVNNNSYVNGADIQQYTANTSDAQKFYVNENPDGYLIFAHKNAEGSSGSLLDMDVNTLNVQQWSAGGSLTIGQQWKAELIGLTPGQLYRLIPQSAQGQVLDVDANNSNNGSKVQVWNKQNNVNQRWTLENVTGGVRFKSAFAPTRFLDIDVASSKAQIWEWVNNSNQRWNLVRSGGQWMRIVPGHDANQSLEATGGTANGSQVNSKPNSSGASQRWRFGDVDN